MFHQATQRRRQTAVHVLLCGVLAWQASFALAAEPTPVVEEDVDAIACVYVADGCSRVLFFRAQRLLADRLLDDEMRWVIAPDAVRPFELHWNDCGLCDRVVRSRELLLLSVARDPLACDGGEWWQQNRRMTDLKAP